MGHLIGNNSSQLLLASLWYALYLSVDWWRLGGYVTWRISNEVTFVLRVLLPSWRQRTKKNDQWFPVTSEKSGGIFISSTRLWVRVWVKCDFGRFFFLLIWLSLIESKLSCCIGAGVFVFFLNFAAVISCRPPTFCYLRILLNLFSGLVLFANFILIDGCLFIVVFVRVLRLTSIHQAQGFFEGLPQRAFDREGEFFVSLFTLEKKNL